MSQWKKVEDEVKKPLKPVDDNIKAGTPKGRDNEAETPKPQHKPRHTSGGRRVGRFRMAAPLGFIVLVLAVVGLVSVIIAGIRTVERAMDNTELKEELYEFLLPVMQYDPEPFTDVNKTKQDALLLAAIWRVTEAERIRQLVDGSGVSAYPMDDNGRMLISVEEIEESYKYLSVRTPYRITIR